MDYPITMTSPYEIHLVMSNKKNAQQMDLNLKQANNPESTKRGVLRAAPEWPLSSVIYQPVLRTNYWALYWVTTETFFLKHFFLCSFFFIIFFVRGKDSCRTKKKFRIRVIAKECFENLLRKILIIHLIYWCGNFMYMRSFCRVMVFYVLTRFLEFMFSHRRICAAATGSNKSSFGISITNSDMMLLTSQ